MKKIIIAIALIWLGIVSGILFYNEMLIVNGQEVLLKIVPVDPRDFLRGDYVSLHYDINEMPKNSKYYGEYRDEFKYIYRMTILVALLSIWGITTNYMDGNFYAYSDCDDWLYRFYGQAGQLYP